MVDKSSELKYSPPLVQQADMFMQKHRNTQSTNTHTELAARLSTLSQRALLQVNESLMDHDTPIDPVVLNVLAGELAQAVQERVQSELPNILQAVPDAMLVQLEQDLQTRIKRVVHTALKDFLLERERISRLQSGR